MKSILLRNSKKEKVSIYVFRNRMLPMYDPFIFPGFDPIFHDYLAHNFADLSSHFVQDPLFHSLFFFSHTIDLY